jgi:hypothetical protein
MGHDVFRHDTSGGHKGKLPKVNAADDGAIGTEGGSASDHGGLEFGLSRQERSGKANVREDATGAHKHVIFQSDSLVDGDVVLDANASPDVNIVCDVHILAEDAAFANVGTRRHMAKMPDARGGSNVTALVHDGRGVDERFFTLGGQLPPKG